MTDLQKRVVFGAGVAAMVSLLWGCAPQPVRTDVPAPPVIAATAPSEQEQLLQHWAGTYQGVMPCNGCAGMAMSVQLRADQTASVRVRALGRSTAQVMDRTYDGPFTLEQFPEHMATLVSAPGAEIAYRFALGPGWIELRERASGRPLGSSSESLFRLRKTSE